MVHRLVQVWDAHKHLSQGMKSGEVQPLPWTVYSRDHAQEAFRFLAGGGRRPLNPTIILHLSTLSFLNFMMLA